MTVKMLQHVLLGLPDNCTVKLVSSGTFYDIDVIGITRNNTLPDPRRFHSINESIVIASDADFEMIGQEVKKVYRDLPGRIDEGL